VIFWIQYVTHGVHFGGLPEATTPQIDSALIDRLIQVESGGDPTAIGAAGEIGLGQIMEATASNPGFGVAGIDPATLTDPTVNRQFTTDYLTGLSDHYGGDLEKALAAYNWGAGNVNQQGLDAMPASTRSYIDNILNV